MIHMSLSLQTQRSLNTVNEECDAMAQVPFKIGQGTVKGAFQK